MALIGGLFHAEEDAQLVELSQYAPTHRLLAETSRTRVGSAIGGDGEARHGLAGVAIASEQGGNQARYTLIVPHLCLPWATTLCEQLWRRLRLRLHPVNATTSRPADVVFYPSLTPPDIAANQRVLRRVHETHPRLVPRLACCVKLAYANALLHALVRHRAALAALLQRPLFPSASASSHHRPSGRAHAPNPHQPRAIAGPARPGAAESGSLASPDVSQHQCDPQLQQNHHQRSKTAAFEKDIFSIAPSRKNPPTAVRLVAHPLPPLRPSPAAYLLHGVAVPAALLPTTRRLLRRFAVVVDTPLPFSDPPATLFNLSSAAAAAASVAAVATDRTHSTSSSRTSAYPRAYPHAQVYAGRAQQAKRQLAPRRWSSPARGPRVIDDAVDAFVMSAYSMRWPTLCAAVVRHARVLVEHERRQHLTREIEALESPIQRCRALREKLVAAAIDHEVAGSSLANISAFAIARTDAGQFDRLLAGFAHDYVRQVTDARHRIAQLTASDTRSAAVLVAGIRTPPY